MNARRTPPRPSSLACSGFQLWSFLQQGRGGSQPFCPPGPVRRGSRPWAVLVELGSVEEGREASTVPGQRRRSRGLSRGLSTPPNKVKRKEQRNCCHCQRCRWRPEHMQARDGCSAPMVSQGKRSPRHKVLTRLCALPRV